MVGRPSRASPRQRAAGGRSCLDVAAEPARNDRGLACLLAQRLRLQPVAPPELHGRGSRDAALAHRVPRALRATRMGGGRGDGRHLRARRGVGSSQADLRAAPAEDTGRQGAFRRGPDALAGAIVTPSAPCAERASGPDRVPRVHERHHRPAKGRHAQRQHAARQRPGDGVGLGAEREVRAAHSQPHQPPHRHRGGGAGAGGRLRARHARSHRGNRGARLDRDHGRHLRHGRAHARDGSAARSGQARRDPARRGEGLLHGGRSDPHGNRPAAAVTRRDAPECLRDDRERLASVHQADGFSGGHYRYMRQGVRGL